MANNEPPTNPEATKAPKTEATPTDRTPGLTEAAFLGFITALAYVACYIFETNQCIYFGLPLSFITITPEKLIPVAWFVGLTVYVLILGFSSLLKGGTTALKLSC